MRAKTPRRSLRYLLYADKTLQRLTLRRLSVRAKKTNKPPRTVRTKKTAARRADPSMRVAEAVPAEQPTRSRRRTDPWWMAFAAVCIVGIVVLIGVPSSSQRANPASARVETDNTEPQDDAALVPLDTLKPASKAAVTSGAARTRKTGAPTTSNRAAEPAAKLAIEPTASANPAPNAAAQNAAPVTIQGCLQAGNEGFWLKDTTGADAPTSRNWKTGFLKKRSTSVEVVEAVDSLRLANYLGQRVAATGSLTNRRLQVRSLHRVAGSCN